ncbi:zinc finger protein 346 isoform X3 [Sorex araneus]|uniref:zinc finger protein 346 isoform X3 n=1 Tax=Sorex araneus TaxID=42254 RepID=UPI0024337AA0|nr:zinc finger protein 346 isoform X3 [Sorex araneus]
MQRPGPGPAEAGDGGGGARRGGSPEAPGGPEPDGPRCDRERARCLREAVSAALPVGKKEVESMIQKNQCLFTNTQCKVCCALLISESQKLAHYQSKKHANKVKRYLIIHGMETLKGDAKKLDSDQGAGGRDQSQCCPLCSATFSSPAVARSHYLGKTHAKNLKLKQPPAKGEALSRRLAAPPLGASPSQEAPAPDQFCSVCHAAFNDPAMAQQHYQGKKHRKQETKLRLMAHYGRLAGPVATGSLGPPKQRLRPQARAPHRSNPWRETWRLWKTRGWARPRRGAAERARWPRQGATSVPFSPERQAGPRPPTDLAPRPPGLRRAPVRPRTWRGRPGARPGALRPCPPRPARTPLRPLQS